jgi:glycosyltransferase involved in cell wall biosynthesis
MNESLSICIPTYNRAGYLLQTLEAFLPQVLPLQIPIYISDNGSTDNTIEMLAQFKKDRYPLLFYKITASNLGIDRNIVNAVAMASSQYVWLFGDDDIPRACAVERVLSNLNHEYKLIIVNASSYNSDLSVQVEKKRVKLSQNRIYSSSEHEQLLIDTASYTGFLGGLVIDKKLWHFIPSEEYLGSDYVHVAVVFRYIVGHRALFLAEPLINIRLGGASWAKRYFEVELINWPKIIWGLPAEQYSDKAKNKICQKNPTHSVKRMLATRAYGYYGKAEYVQYIKPDIVLSKWKKELLHIMIYLPQKLAKFMLGCFKCLQFIWKKPNLNLTFYRLSQ